MIGWTLEYYHITKRAHDCISPAIAKGHGEFRSMLLDFFHEEYRHDKLLLKSLKSLGFEEHEITNSIPLPYTAAVSNLLAKWAHTDLLSYMASLFIFEGTAMEGNDYVQALDVYEMPREFSIHQAAHNNINTEGDHGNVSREFYASIEYITAEDQARVIRNIRLLHEAQLRAHDTIFEYYLKPDVKMPRLLDNLLVSNA
nr:iron-containing redox enzyme family protein [Tumebacillus amylolyticus]